MKKSRAASGTSSLAAEGGMVGRSGKDGAEGQHPHRSGHAICLKDFETRNMEPKDCFGSVKTWKINGILRKIFAQILGSLQDS